MIPGPIMVGPFSNYWAIRAVQNYGLCFAFAALVVALESLLYYYGHGIEYM